MISNLPVTIKTRPCPSCGQVATLTVDQTGIDALGAGAHVQDAFPMLSDADRERLISGTCGPCWAQMFSGMEDEED